MQSPFEYYALKSFYKTGSDLFPTCHSLFQNISTHVSNLRNIGLMLLIPWYRPASSHTSASLDPNFSLTLVLPGLFQSWPKVGLRSQSIIQLGEQEVNKCKLNDSRTVPTPSLGARLPEACRKEGWDARFGSPWQRVERAGRFHWHQHWKEASTHLRDWKKKKKKKETPHSQEHSLVPL